MSTRTMTGAGGYQMVAAIGQPDAGTSANGGFTLQGGFIPGAITTWQAFLPEIRR